jgi:hypothetical protein
MISSVVFNDMEASVGFVQSEPLILSEAAR